MEDQEFVYLTNEEKVEEGYHAAVSANMNGLSSSKAFQDVFFRHPQFGEFKIVGNLESESHKTSTTKNFKKGRTWIVGKADCTHECHLFISTKRRVITHKGGKWWMFCTYK